MHTIGVRNVAVILVVLALVSAAWPAAAAPRRTTDQPRVATPVIEAVSVWLAGLWQGFGEPSPPSSAWEALGPVGDPNGAPQPAGDGWAAPSPASPDDAPTG